MNQKITRAVGRAGLILKKYSPEMLLGVGMVGLVGSTAMIVSHKRKLKAQEIITKAENGKKGAVAARDGILNDPDIMPYSDGDYRKEVTKVYLTMTGDLIKLYGPAVTLAVGSVTSILASHNIMRKRYLGVVAAYKGLESSFTKYRERVVAELGEDKDREFKYGLKHEEVEVVEEDGSVTKMGVNIATDTSVYARFFDETCPDWTKTPEYNLVFLKAQQNFANDKLNARGHIFLNEVYDMLGIPRTTDGAAVGWRIDGDGDGFVDFGIMDYWKPKNRDFVNGYERSILLDFNVDGCIFDKLDSDREARL